MSWEQLLTTISCLASCASLYGATVTDANSLNTALTNANTSGDPTITFSNAISLAGFAPPLLFPVNSDLTFSPISKLTLIDGGGFSLTGTATQRGFFVRGGSPTIQNMTITGCSAVGGAGGAGAGGGMGAGAALYVGARSNVTLIGCTISSCTATGGLGGTTCNTGGQSGGGGGLTGAGGNAAGAIGGGGGGGFATAGGSGGNDGGGGGGATLTVGTDSPGDGSGGTGGENYAGTAGGSGGTAGSGCPAGGNPGGDAGATTASGTGGGGGGFSQCVTGGAGTTGSAGGGGGGSGGTADGGGISAKAGGAGSSYGGGGGGGSVIGVAIVGDNNGGTGGNGGFGGGGGSGGAATNSAIVNENSYGGNGGQGGFGGGGGGGGPGTGGNSCHGGLGNTSLYGGGTGGSVNTVCGMCGAGGNGAGLGGGIFIEYFSGVGGTLTLQNSIIFSGNTAKQPATGIQGFALGNDIYMMSGTTLNFNLISSLTLSNPIQSDLGAGGGTGGGINVSGSATVDFATNNLQNTYTGTTTISNNGTLKIASDSNLGASGAALSNPLVMDATTGNPTLEASGAVTLTSARNLSFTGSGTSTFLVDTGGSLGVAGPLAMGTGNLAVNTQGTTTCNLSGIISGAGTLTKSGTGTLTLSGTAANTYSSVTTVNGGTLALQKTAGLNAISSTVVVNTGGTVQLLAANQTGSGNMTLAGGTFNMQTFATTLNSLTFNSGTLTQGAGATLTFGSTSQTPAALTMQTGTTISGPIVFPAGAFAVLTGATGTAMINGTVNLGGGNVTFNTGTSAASILQVAGAMSNGGITITGSGTLLFPNPQSIDSLTFMSGMLSQSAGATITLNNAVTALTMYGGTTIAGQVSIPSSGGVAFNASNNGTATISGGVTLGPGTNTWSIARGTAPFDMTVSGSIGGNGSLVKSGAGLLNISGIANYGGSTIVSAGTLAVNGSLTTTSVTVDVGGTLQGTGTIHSSVNVMGTLSPGNSIGTLTVENGNVTLTGTSTYVNEITPTSTDLLQIVGGSLTIDPVATFALQPAPTFYDPDTSFLVISTTGGVNGTFTNFTTTFPIMSKLVYTPTDVFLEINIGEFNKLVPFGNCHSVALALDEIFAGGNPMDPIFTSFFAVPPDQYCHALNQLQPSLYKGIGVIQQNTAVRVVDTVKYRFQNILDETYCNRTSQDQKIEICPRDDEFFHLWVDGFGSILHQASNRYANSAQVGYGSGTAGIIEGFDFHFADYFYLGALGGYTRSYITWNNHHGKGEVGSGYAGLYVSAIDTLYYANASVIRAWNEIDAHRNIIYPGTNQRAYNSHSGNQVISHLDTGLNFQVGTFALRPFDAVDYITQQEHQYKEHGAGAYNLIIRGKTLRMVRNELGLNFARCYCYDNGKFTVDGKLSWVYEGRLKGKSTTSRFQGTSSNFTVDGYYKSRSLGAIGLSLSYKNSWLDTTIYYDGEFTVKYWDQDVGLQLGFDF